MRRTPAAGRRIWHLLTEAWEASSASQGAAAKQAHKEALLAADSCDQAIGQRNHQLRSEAETAWQLWPAEPPALQCGSQSARACLIHHKHGSAQWSAMLVRVCWRKWRRDHVCYDIRRIAGNAKYGALLQDGGFLRHKLPQDRGLSSCLVHRVSTAAFDQHSMAA